MGGLRGIFARRHVLAALLLVASVGLPGLATGAEAAGQAAVPSAEALLARAKEATGGAAWDAMRTQHSKVSIVAGSREGTAERWASILTGRSRMRLEVEGTVAFMGYDGFAAWSQEGGRVASVDTDPVTARLAVNTAYRDRLGFWFPDRHAARIEYVGRRVSDGSTFDVVAITPEGGVRYEAWIDTTTHRIERQREPEYNGVRTEVYADFRQVQGVTVPFEVRITRNDPRYDERYTVSTLEYNVPIDDRSLAMPQAR